MVTKSDFFEDIAVALETWTEAGVDATTNADADLQWVESEEPYRILQSALKASQIDPTVVRQVLSECLCGFAISFLTALDGGSALAEKGRVYLVDDIGMKLGEGLHDDFVGHLMDTGRFE